MLNRARPAPSPRFGPIPGPGPPDRAGPGPAQYRAGSRAGWPEPNPTASASPTTAPPRQYQTHSDPPNPSRHPNSGSRFENRLFASSTPTIGNKLKKEKKIGVSMDMATEGEDRRE
ncbi:unnamed protein product [Cuscuta europaea]|uniref:Uncharacterized protein n=1 Tax=Cuscuta europaea TaxID=41803 RepID=A0A9P0ZMC2_CUSEU|nr:unnamed protein product [Cuscuta europaea]